MSDLEAEACRNALAWRQKYEELWDAIDSYRLWQPGRRGYAAARRELERVWLEEDEDCRVKLCMECRGTGVIGSPIKVPCPVCKGTGDR
jgi:hypothetical protein